VFLDPGSARLKPLVRDDGVLFFAEVQVLENRNIIIGQALRSHSVRNGSQDEGWELLNSL
jgi:hypothetical protein